MKALPSSGTFGLLAVPSTTSDPACDHSHDPRSTILNDEHYERQNGDRCPASLETHRSASSRCVAIILVVAGLLISGAIASACAYHRPATTIVIDLNNERILGEGLTDFERRASLRGWLAWSPHASEAVSDPIAIGHKSFTLTGAAGYGERFLRDEEENRERRGGQNEERKDLKNGE